MQIQDPTFKASLPELVKSIALSDGALILDGKYKLGTDGSFLPFQNSIAGFSFPQVSLVTADQITVSGRFTKAGATAILLKLNPDGSVASSVTSGLGQLANTHAQDQAGRVYIGGPFTSVGSDWGRRCLARINADGSYDASYQPVIPYGNQVHAILPLPTGGILAGLTDWTGKGVTKFTDTGAVDTSFVAGYPQNGIITKLSHATGGYLVAGQFPLGGYPPSNRLYKLALDGSLAPGFTPLLFKGQVPNAIIQDGDGFVLAGNFYDINGLPGTEALARINADGSVDTTYSSGFPFAFTGFRNPNDGLIYVSVYQWTPSGVVNYITRLVTA